MQIVVVNKQRYNDWLNNVSNGQSTSSTATPSTHLSFKGYVPGKLTSYIVVRISYIYEGDRKKPVDWWRNENARKTGLMCLGGGSVGWVGVGMGGVSGDRCQEIFSKFPGNFFEVSGKFPRIVDVSGAFKMILCDEKIKFWYTAFTKMTIRSCLIRLLNIEYLGKCNLTPIYQFFPTPFICIRICFWLSGFWYVYRYCRQSG